MIYLLEHNVNGAMLAGTGIALTIQGLIVALVSDDDDDEVAMEFTDEPDNPYFDPAMPAVGVAPIADGAMATMLMRF